LILWTFFSTLFEPKHNLFRYSQFFAVSRIVLSWRLGVLGYPLKLLMNLIESRHGHDAVVETLLEAGLPRIASTVSMSRTLIKKPNVCRLPHSDAFPSRT
jgi:hypothetical protein